MSWQWVVLILGLLAFFAIWKYLEDKRKGVVTGLAMMEENNVLLKMFMALNGVKEDT